ncbi:MAG: hypothetical protein JOY59_08665 [Candidatus Eremiobacteraeota bacterium]|nr:hypothetical protein [Candidatus Eremiobacteraeota bacterium]
MPCALPAGVSATLVYPAPGSTGNTTSPAQIVIAGSGTLPPTSYVLLSFPFNSATGTARFGSQIGSVSPPFPTPNATPSFANPTYYGSDFSYLPTALPGNSTITATLNDTSNACSPGVTLGTFHT